MNNRLYNLAETRGWLCSEQAPARTKFSESRQARPPSHNAARWLSRLTAKGVTPLLFLLYNDDLRSVVPETMKVVQRVVTAVAEWSTSKEMVLNADKRESTFFSTNSHESNWQPTLIANNTCLHRNPQPKFFGVTLSRLLTFGPHIQGISTKAAARCRVEKGSADESLQSSAVQPPNLRGSGVA